MRRLQICVFAGSSFSMTGKYSDRAAQEYLIFLMMKRMLSCYAFAQADLNIFVSRRWQFYRSKHQTFTKAILKILSVCCAPTDPPKSPRPKFFFRYFRFFIFFFSGFRALRSYAENRHQRRRRTSKIISVRPDSKGMSYIPISFRMINSCQNKYFKCISEVHLKFIIPVTLLSNKHLSRQCQTCG